MNQTLAEQSVEPGQLSLNLAAATPASMRLAFDFSKVAGVIPEELASEFRKEALRVTGQQPGNVLMTPESNVIRITNYSSSTYGNRNSWLTERSKIAITFDLVINNQTYLQRSAVSSNSYQSLARSLMTAATSTIKAH